MLELGVLFRKEQIFDTSVSNELIDILKVNITPMKFKSLTSVHAHSDIDLC